MAISTIKQSYITGQLLRLGDILDYKLQIASIESFISILLILIFMVSFSSFKLIKPNYDELGFYSFASNFQSSINSDSCNLNNSHCGNLINNLYSQYEMSYLYVSYSNVSYKLGNSSLCYNMYNYVIDYSTSNSVDKIFIEGC